MNILLIEDQAMVRGALSALLNLEDDMTVTHEASDGLQAQKILTQTASIDLLVTDIQMPHCDGLELSQWVRTHYPDLPIVMLTTFARAGYLTRALKAGASGFLLKDSPADRLAGALRDVLSGRKVIDSELALLALGAEDPLSDKERQALVLAQKGMTTSMIADQLFLSEGTVRNYLSEAISKLGAENRIDAARIATEKGWL